MSSPTAGGPPRLPSLLPPLSERDPEHTNGSQTQVEHEEEASNSLAVQLTDQTNLLPFKKIIACFFGLALCIVVSTLDAVIVATALPTISSAFDAGRIVSWVPSAYLLTSTSFQPLYGRFSDIFGRKVAISIAMLVFMLGNLLSGFSRTIIQLIVFRGMAGAGGGSIISLSQIVISDIVSLRERGKYQGIIGGVIALGYAIGPIIGGALAQKVSWRWCFWFSIPTSLCALSVVFFILPLKPVTGDIRKKLLAVDFLGAILTLIGCALVILPTIWVGLPGFYFISVLEWIDKGGVTFPWKSAIVLATLFSGFLVVVIFCFWEWKGARLPIVPMYIFKHATVTGVYITMFVNGFIYFNSLYYLPQYFQVVLGYDPIGAGIFLIPVLLAQMVAGWMAGVVVSRTGRYRNIIHSGFAILSLGCGLTSTITPRSQKAELVIYMLLAGCGSGQTLQTTTVAAQASVSRQDMSVVTAFRNFIRLLGGTLALAVGATIINNSLRSAMHDLSLPSSTITNIIDSPSRLASPTELASLGISPTMAQFILNSGYTNGFRMVFVLDACLAAVATLASIFMIKHKELTRVDDEALKKRQREEEEEEEKHKMKVADRKSAEDDVDVEKHDEKVEVEKLDKSFEDNKDSLKR